MNNSIFLNSKFSLHNFINASRCVALLVLLGFIKPAWAQIGNKVTANNGAGLQIVVPDPRASLLTEAELGYQGLTAEGLAGFLGKRGFRNWVHKVSVDSTGQFVVANETFMGNHVRPMRIVTLQEYRDFFTEYTLQKAWREGVTRNFSAAARRRSGSGGLNIELPVEIKNQAFQRIFGGDKVGLNVQGEIRIDGGFRNENRSEQRTSLAQGSNTNFKMNQQQRFTVTGKIGEKVTVNVDQDSERQLEFENNIKLNYKGFEDEVIQSIEAGSVSLSLPGTRFVTFGGKSAGLFGLKMDAQLGDLQFTTIASQEKGESERLTVDAGSTSNTDLIPDHRYKRNTYFFLDYSYRENWRDYRFEWQHQSSVPDIRDIVVYISTPGAQRTGETFDGIASPDPINDNGEGNTREFYKGVFRRLEPDVDYTLFPILGYLRMRTPVNQGDVLAVAYRDAAGGGDGDVNYNPTSGEPIRLKLIKAQQPLPTFITWNLEWKNVYDLGGTRLTEDGLEIRILLNAVGSQTAQESKGPKTYLEIFGIDIRDNVTGDPQPDGKIELEGIVNLERGELILPFLRPFARDTVRVNNQNVLTSHFDDDIPAYTDLERIYTSTLQTEISEASKFSIEVTSSSASSTYQLGFNVIENSEEVRLNGRELVRGADYTIDYWSGTLTILNEEAKGQNAGLDITYERNQLFQLQKKTILGTNARYQINQNSFVGATFLYLNERTLDQKIRVGSGPIRNMIWDVNTALNFTPNFLTRAVDALPFIDATQPSSLKFEGEIAQILPNPNTLNNKDTGDNDGVAYIDDFEGGKRTTPLGIQRKGWTLASVPVQYQLGSSRQDPLYGQSVQNMGELYWFNPFGGVPIRSIYPNQEVTAQTAQVTDILTMVFKPKNGQPDSWGGIMRGLSSGFFDQTESKFIEVMVRGDKGVVHVDLGQVSEDVIPNDEYDTEDFALNGFRNGNLDLDLELDDGTIVNEDRGLDQMADNDPRAIAAGGDFWDINNDGVKQDWEPFSNDNWRYDDRSVETRNFYNFINGTENSSNDGIRLPDSEDLNGNRTTDFVNNYFEYTFDLASFEDEQRYVRGGENGWRLFRIPLFDFMEKVGDPRLNSIEYARIWIDGVANEDSVVISIADISLVGSEWQETDREDTRLAVTVLNTHENAEVYIQPPGVSGVIDRITQARAREQALVLQVNDLEPGGQVTARKSFFTPQDYIHYKRMRMFVHAIDRSPDKRHIQPTSEQEAVDEDTTKSDMVFFLRFGSNEDDYYEFRELVFGGESSDSLAWDGKNEMDIDLAQLTNLKFDSAYVAYIDSLGTPSAPEFFEYQANPTQWYRIKGRPSITNIRLLTLGVEHLRNERNGHTDFDNFNGEVWLNELRLSQVEKEKGIAMRARMDLSLSDFIKVNAEVNRRDADFHNVQERFNRNQDNRRDYSVNGSMSLDKFFPSSWGLSIPVTVNYAETRSTPKRFPGQDILITEATPLEQIQLAQTLGTKQGFSVSASKRTKSKNFFIRNTVDNIRASLSHSRDERSSENIKEANSENWSGNVDYSLNFGRNNYFKPFTFLKSIPLIKNAANTRFYYTPSSFSGKLQGNSAKSFQETRQGAVTNSDTYFLTRSYNLNHKVFDNLTASLAKTWKGDFRERQWQGLFSGEFQDSDKSQNFKVDYSPQIVSWIQNKFGYTSSFRYRNNIAQPERGRDVGANTNINANMTVRVSQLFKKGRTTRSSAGTARRRRNTPRRRTSEPGQQAGEEEKKEEKKKGGGFGPGSIFKFVKNKLGDINDIRITYQDGNNYTNSGLDSLGAIDRNYIFGFSTNPGIGLVDTTLTGILSTEARNKTLRFDTGWQLSRGIDLKVAYTRDEQNNLTSRRSGSFSKSAIQIGDGDPIPFPEITLSVSGLEKLIPIFKPVAKSMTVSSNLSGKNTIAWEDTIINQQKQDFSFSFRPLIRVSMNWKNGMVTNVQINKTTGFNNRLNPIYEDDIFMRIAIASGQRQRQQDIQFTTTYSKRSGFKIPLPFLSKKKLNNSIDFSVNFNMNKTVTEQNVSGEENKYVVSQETSRWTFKPSVTYSFSNRVKGGTFFEVGKTSSTIAGDVSIKEFGINVNISIRGN